MAVVAKGLIAIGLLAYPILVWFGLAQGRPRTVALILLCVLIPTAWLRWRGARRLSQRSGGCAAPQQLRGLAVVPLIAIVALILGAVLDRAGYVLLVPAAINGAMLVAFGSTLRAGAMPMVERFARLQLSNPSSEQVAWCRMWTWIWMGFFVANGGIALVLALWGPLDWWAFYNGLLAYALMGVLFAVEWTLRRRRFG